MNYLLDKISEIIFDCVFAVLQRQLGYLFKYRSYVENLNTLVEELRVARDEVKRNVDKATNDVQTIKDNVVTWLNDSEGVIKKAYKTIEDNGQANMTCCNGWCPNLKSRYQVGRRSYKMGLEVEESKDKCKFDSVGYSEPTQLVVTVKLNSGYEDFKSRKSAITGVLDALKHPDINRIGVHGMGGVGKTMLVKEVVNQAEKDKLFNNYVFVAVSKEPDLKKIQTQIAKQLGLELDKEDDFGRPGLLYKRLQQGKILLVMDDIWEPLKLEDVGYTSGADQKGCKLLLTSRFYRVLVHYDMGTQKQFEVGILSKGEARNLFENIIGDSAKNHEIQQIMLQIVEECSGLPVAITTVANALKNQEDICVWKDALVRFKISNPKTIYGMNEKVYKSIKWSYEFLKDNEAKSLWLLCSLHGEDYDIEVEDLVRFCVGWKLFRDLGKIEQVRCRVRTFVKELKDCSLLLDGDDNGTVKMHDIIRDVALDIAAKERHMFSIRSSVELQERSKSKNSTVISLPYINDDLELPNQFECSKLELLLLFDQKVYFRIPDSFFEGLKDLKVLKLSGSWSGVLPSSLSSLENLQTLCLDGKVLDGKVQNAIIIGELKNLKALSLALFGTGFANVRLPKEIGQLTHLQLLDLGKCWQLNSIPPNVLSNLKMLEELYLPDNVEWEVEARSTESINAMVSELDDLAKLTKLHICIENAKILPDTKVFKRLESYRIAIGSAWDSNETWETSRILKLKISFQSDCVYKELFRKCETLILEKMKGVKNILYELESEGFQSLKHLKVEDNDEIQYIIKSMGVLDSVSPSLESITLWNVNNLERICYTQLPTKTFCNLRMVNVRNCRKLEFIFSTSMVGCFSHLQKMKIEDCEIMSAIVAIEREEEIEVNSDDSIMFANLHSLKLRNLFKLKGFLSVVHSRVLFNGKVVFPILKKLEIKGMHSMNMIWPDQLISDFFGKLETLNVSACANLTKIVPPNMLRMLRNLKELNIERCGSIEEVFDVQGTNNVEESRDIAAAELISLTLRYLEKVKHVWSMDPQGIITFGKLRTIKIEGCSSLKSVFPTSVAKALMQLEKLEIKDCATVEEIVAKEEGIETTTLFVFPQLTNLALQNLPELKSFYPGNHTSEWPSLKDVCIHKCDKLKIFGSNKSSVEETNGLGHHASLILHPLFFVKKDKFPNLERLELDEGDAMNEKCGGPSAEFCCNLKKLRLYGNGEIPNVEAPIARAGVSDFRRLKNIVPFSSTSFHNLEYLRVYRSDVLFSLLTPSIARTLVQLQWIDIMDCKRMTEIVANEGSEAEAGDEIAFNNLKYLKFYNLPSLTAFHLGNRTIKFPSLVEVTVNNCPKLISLLTTSTARTLVQLERIEILDCKRMTEIVANEGSEAEARDEIAFNNLKYLEFYDLPSLTAFHLGNRTIKFPSLVEVTVNNCPKLISLLTTSTAKTLVQLKRIEIRDCERMTEIVANEGSEAEAGDEIAFNNLKYLKFYNLPSLTAFHLGNRTIKFPSLVEVTLNNCPKLISLLTPSTARTLVQLERIEIRDCERMTEIVANEGSEAEAGDEIAFNNLKYLEFYNLSSLTAFHLGNCTIKFPSLVQVEVDNCPKLKIFCSGVLSTPKLRFIGIEGKQITKEGRDGDLDLNATIKEYWEAKLETCDQEFAEKILKKKGDGDVDLNATIKEYWEAELETCDQKFVEKTDASDVREREHDANDNLETDTTSEVGDTM